MKREAFKMFLKSGYEKEYERRHAAIWPELKMVGLYGRYHEGESRQFSGNHTPA